MGLMDKLVQRAGGVVPREVTDQVSEQGSALVDKLLTLGFDGYGPFDSARQVADAALAARHGDAEAAIRELTTSHRNWAAAGGFVTGFGGLLTAVVAIPGNVLEFYLLATRQTAAIAHLRGYDIDKPETRSAVVLTLVGADADDVLRRAGASIVPGGVMGRVAVGQLPPTVRMVVNKAVGFRLVQSLGTRFLSRMGKLLPVVGGLLGAGLDHRGMKHLAARAKKEFPPRERLAA